MTQLNVQNRTTQEMVYEAVTEALDDSDMDMKDINAIVVSTMDCNSNGERQKLYPSVLCSMFKTKLPSIRVPAVCGGSGASLWTSLRLDYNNILVIGVERLASTTSAITTDNIMMAAERIYEQSEGMLFPAQNALVAQQYMLKYKATTDDFALVSLKNHENALLNPKARFYKKKVTLEEIKESPIIASPLRLFDCCPNVNAAAACIITKDKTDIKITGSSLYSDYLSAIEREDMTTFDATKLAANDVYKQANINANEINFAEVHDAFTPLELLNYEDLGFCKKGEGKNLIRDGTTKLDGKLPVNPCGGLKAKGHPISATGIAQIYEIIKQMRKEAGDRQLSRTKIALAQNIGGVGSTVAVHILKRVGG